MSETHRQLASDSLHRDLALVTGAQVMLLHKALVLPHSRLLSDLVTCAPASTNLVNILDSDTDPYILAVVIELLYTGQSELSDCDMREVEEVTRMLGLDIKIAKDPRRS